MSYQNSIKKKTPFYLKKFKILIILLILIIALPGYFLVIKPEYAAYAENKQLSAQYQQELDAAIKQLKSYRQTIIAYQSVSSLEEDKINQILPDHMDEASLYVNLESLVKAAGLDLDSIVINPVDTTTKKKSLSQKEQEIEPTQAALSDRIGLVSIDINTSDASYAKMKAFLASLEDNLRLIDIDNFNFNAIDGDLGLVLKTYYLK